MDIRRELEYLIKKAEQALKELADCTTCANQNALIYMVRQAEAALRGEKILPVSNSREFMHMGDEELLEWVYSHYVMFGFDRKEGQEWEYYGLKHALEYFIDSAADTENGKNREIRENRQSFFFRCGKKDYLLFSEEEWESIKSRLEYDSQLKEQYGKIRTIAEKHTREEVEEIWNATWNVTRNAAGDSSVSETDTVDGTMRKERHIDVRKELYSDTAKGITFRVPEGVAGTHLCFSLSEDSVGLQDFLIRGVRIVGADGKEWEIGEEGDVALGKGLREWEWPEALPLEPGEMYTLHFRVNQRKKLKKGIQVILRYEDENGREKDSFCWEYNRKAWYPVHTFNLDMQCNGICYGVTGDVSYAEKAMRQMVLFMDDFCQGAAYWMCYNRRPEGRDNYGAVQAGRDLCSIAMTYAFIKDAPVWDNRESFVRMAEFILNDVFDLRDRTCLPPEEAQRGTSNWQTDMCIGAALLAAAVAEIPYREQWIRNAEAVLSAQLACNLNPDGSWPESLRYHHATLERFCTFARFWEHETGEDFFHDNHLERMFAFSIGVQMPPYAYFGNRISTPPFGDHCLGGGQEYHILSGWIKKAAEVDPVLAAGMRETWERTGIPVREPGGEMVVVELLLAIDKAAQDTGIEDGSTIRAGEKGIGEKVSGTEGIKKKEAEIKMDLDDYRTKSRVFPDAGLYLFRREQSGACLAVMCNKRRIGHGHLDQGSFLFYYHNVPLIMDSGIEGYFDTTTQWHISSYSHACMLFEAMDGPGREETAEINLSAGNFAKRHGWCDTPGIARLLGCSMGAGQEQIRMEIRNSCGQGVHTRTITYKEDCNIIIRDEIREFRGEVLFCLPMLLEEAELEFSDGYAAAAGTGYYGAGMKVESLMKVKRAWIDWGRVTPMHPGREKENRIPFLRMAADAETGFEISISARKTNKNT